MKLFLKISALVLTLALLTGCALFAPETTAPESTAPAQTFPTVDTTQTMPTTQPAEKPLVVIDAGHQKNADYEQEPIGPGATETKSKVAPGTIGTVTGIREYVLNLAVAEMLQKLLEERGYRVVMIRTDHDVNISNSQRAMTANTLQADAFIRIHANSSTNKSAQGAFTICQTQNNPYNSALYDRCKTLAQCVLDGLIDATGAVRREIWETDTMSGINWCQVPVTIVEMGYMSNPEEDQLMATQEYRMLLAQGIADGIDRYFQAISKESG